jgi:hypothetical protein
VKILWRRGGRSCCRFGSESTSTLERSDGNPHRSSLPTAAPHHDVVRCLLVIELSKASWIVAVHTPLSDKISRYTLEGCDWKGLLELIERRRIASTLRDCYDH